MTARRIVSIWLPRFPIELWRRRAAGAPASDEAPLALVTEGPHGAMVHALNQAAGALGFRPGARLVDLRALCPELKAEAADLAADAEDLRRLAGWCRRWCPWSAVDGTDGIVLDASGSAHLWGGDAAMLADIAARLGTLGLGARLAVAPSRGAAWALARFGEAQPVCAGGETEPMLAPLPVESLRLDAETVLLLRRLGLKTVAALAAMPRLALARRFPAEGDAAANPLLRLDQALGRTLEPVAPAAEAPPLRAVLLLAEPALDAAPFLEGLAAQLCAELERRGLGVRRLRFAAYRVDGDVGTVEAATSRASRDTGHLRRLFEGRFETLDPGFGFDALELAALTCEPLDKIQTRLGGEEAGEVQLSRLTDRLVARLGPAAVTRPALRESHLPERAEAWVSVLGEAARKGAQPQRQLPERPIRLLTPPEEIRVVYAVPEGPPARFVWRRLPHDVVRHQGPERIAPEWWRQRSTARLRDYYRVEDTAGRRYWLFREGAHGDGRGGPPRWFVHGLFG